MTSSSVPISYMQRTRDYYLALGYDNPYRWAHYEDVPFARLQKPLSESKIAIVTTAAPFQSDKGDQGPGAPYNAAAKFYQVYSASTGEDPDLRISHIAIDRDHTTADDIGSYFPLKALKALAEEGAVGEVAPRFFGLPTNRSQRTTLETDIPQLIDDVLSDQMDAVVLVPNCPVCHQSVSLAAQGLEEANVPTVIMGCALDIVEHCGVPRFFFSDFPLGNSAGRPHRPEEQRHGLLMALQLLETATAPRHTVQSPYIWADDHAWKADYSNLDKLTPEDIAKRRAAFDQGKTQAKAIRDG